MEEQHLTPEETHLEQGTLYRSEDREKLVGWVEGRGLLQTTEKSESPKAGRDVGWIGLMEEKRL